MRKPTVAVIGASDDRTKFGNKSVRAHLAAGFEVYPVNPTATEVEGLRSYESLADLPPGRLDRVTLYVRPNVVLALLDQIASRGADEVWLNPGTESPEVLERAEALGLNVIQACSIVDVGANPAAV